MLLSDFTYINTNNRNYKKFIELGYTFNIGDRLMVKTIDLNLGSKEFVSVKCDICNSEKSIMYYSYIQNTEKYNIYACTRKCADIKFRKTCKENFGCEYPLQNTKIKNNLKGYFLSTYGVSHPSILEEFELKKQNTNLEKYGVKHQMELNENISKIKEIKLEKYGDENYNNHDKSKMTKLDKYDDENYNNHDKCKESKLEKYNDEYYNNRELFVKNFIKKYGVSNPMQISEIYEKQQKSGFGLEYYNNISYRGTYELDFIKFCELNKIKVSKPNTIKYIFEGNECNYYPDFYIEEFNMICEIKSDYYYKLDESRNICKKIYTEKSGYNFIFIINKNYDELKKITTINDTAL